MGNIYEQQDEIAFLRDQVETFRKEVAELRSDCSALAMGYLGISPDRNTQTVGDADAEEARLLEIARKHNVYAVK